MSILTRDEALEVVEKRPELALELDAYATTRPLLGPGGMAMFAAFLLGVVLLVGILELKFLEIRKVADLWIPAATAVIVFGIGRLIIEYVDDRDRRSAARRLPGLVNRNSGRPTDDGKAVLKVLNEILDELAGSATLASSLTDTLESRVSAAAQIKRAAAATPGGGGGGAAPPGAGTVAPAVSPASRQSLWMVLAILGLILVAGFLLAMVLKDQGLSPGWQRGLVFATVFIAVGALAVHRVRKGYVDERDPLPAVVTVAAAAALVVAGLTALGTMDQQPTEGCINSNGSIEATVAAETAIIYEKAASSSLATDTITRGCGFRAVAWCIGTRHSDRTELAVPDVRFLKLGNDQGYVPSGFTVGATFDPADRLTDCPGHEEPPQRIRNLAVRLDPSTAYINVRATAPNAAYVGLARRVPGGWQRVGWGGNPDVDAYSSAWRVNPARQPNLRVGDTLQAVACLGLEQAVLNTKTGSPVQASVVVGRSASTLEPEEILSVAQPIAATADKAACSAAARLP